MDLDAGMWSTPFGSSKSFRALRCKMSSISSEDNPVERMSSEGLNQAFGFTWVQSEDSRNRKEYALTVH